MTRKSTVVFDRSGRMRVAKGAAIIDTRPRLTKSDRQDIVDDMTRTYIQEGPDSICRNAKREVKQMTPIQELEEAGNVRPDDLKKIAKEYKWFARAYASDFCTRAEGGTYIEGLRRRR